MQIRKIHRGLSLKFKKIFFFIMIFPIMMMLLSSCQLFSPTPTNEEILEVIIRSNKMEEEPLDLVWEDMEVPQRLPGQAGAVLWVPDKSIQRNFRVLYDKKEKGFFVESYMTLILGEDGSYRKKE